MIGGANAPGTFANITVFPDLARLMEHKQCLAEGGRKMRYDCYVGDYVMIEEITHRLGE